MNLSSTGGVALLGAGQVANELALLWAAAGVPVTVWGPSPDRVDWLIEDTLEQHPGAPLFRAASAEEAVAGHAVLVPAVPWGDPLNRLLTSLAPFLPGRCVLDVSNPFEMTALGPKQAMYVPFGSAGAGTASVLPDGTGHVHALSQVRADAMGAGARSHALAPYVSNRVHDAGAVAAVAATGWVPVRVGDVEASALVEAAGPWALSRGTAGLGALNEAEARATGLLR